MTARPRTIVFRGYADLAAAFPPGMIWAIVAVRRDRTDLYARAEQDVPTATVTDPRVGFDTPGIYSRAAIDLRGEKS